MFYFEQLLQQALNSIDSTRIMPAVISIATTMVILSVMVAAYQAFFGQGDVRVLGLAGIQTLILLVVFANYGQAFRDVLAMHNSVADFLYHSNNVGDVFGSWIDSLAAYMKQKGNFSFWSLVIGGDAAELSTVFIILALVIFAFSYVVFTLAYTLYGTVLYVTGPFVLALLPIRGLGQLSRTYLVNLFTFFAWGIIYAVFQVLITAINLGSASQVFTAGVLNVAKGASQMLLLSLVSCLFAFSIALIPFIASRVVRGDVGSTMMTLVGVVRSTVSAVAGVAAAAISGGAAGAGAAAGGTAGAGVAAAGGPATTPVVARNSTSGTPSAPTPPPATSAARSYSASGQGSSSTTPESSPAMSRGFSVTRVAAWHAGYQLGKALRSPSQNG